MKGLIMFKNKKIYKEPKKRYNITSIEHRDVNIINGKEINVQEHLSDRYRMLTIHKYGYNLILTALCIMFINIIIPILSTLTITSALGYFFLPEGSLKYSKEENLLIMIQIFGLLIPIVLFSLIFSYKIKLIDKYCEQENIPSTTEINLTSYLEKDFARIRLDKKTLEKYEPKIVYNCEQKHKSNFIKIDNINRMNISLKEKDKQIIPIIEEIFIREINS